MSPSKLSVCALVCTAVLSLSLFDDVHASSPAQCQSDFSTSLVNAKTDPEKCDAIRSLSECINDLGSGVDTTGLTALLENAQTSVDCKAYFENVNKPGIKSDDDNMVFQVDGSKDAVFRRTRRAEVSVFEMNDQLQQIAKNLTSIRADIKSDADAQNDLIAKTISQAVLGLSSKVDGIDNKVNGLSSTILSAANDNIESQLRPVLQDIVDLKAACGPREYKSGDGSCKAVKVCDSRTEYEVQAPTKNTDRKCKAAQVCVKGKTFESVPLAWNQDRQCAAVTECKETEIEIREPSVTEDRLCAPSHDIVNAAGWTRNNPATSCLAIKKDNPWAASGYYWLEQKGKFSVEEFLCDMDSYGGGWTQVGRGIGGRGACWRTSGDCNLNFLKRYDQTFKKSDKKINAIVTDRYWMHGAFPTGWGYPPSNYFWNATKCVYAHTSISRGQCNCVAESPDMTFRRHCGYPHGGHNALGDWGGRFSNMEPDTYGWDGDGNWGSNDCVHTCHSSNYWYIRRAGTKRCGHGYCHAHSARCDIELWVR